MKKQVVKTAAACALLLFLFPVMGLVTTLLTAEDSDSKEYCESCGHHADTHKVWQKPDSDSIETRLDKLEPIIQTLREGPKRRKAEMLAHEIRDILEKLKTFPSKAYRLVMELKELLTENT